MELTHVLTGYWDLYNIIPNLGSFDNMACACGTHPSAFTKQKLGWLDSSAVATHTGQAHSYDLHTLGLVQPPLPAGRQRYRSVRAETSSWWRRGKRSISSTLASRARV